MKKKILKGQEELDQYKFDRNDIALMLNKSPNAIRMLMRRSNCTLEYRWDGKKYLFKRPGDQYVNRPPDHGDKISHSQSVEDYHKQTQKKYNRGATHKGEGKYTNPAFKQHNEMKILNNINGKFTSEAHKREFNELNKEGLKIASENLLKKRQNEFNKMYSNPNKYGEMLTGYKAAQWNDEINLIRDRSDKYDTSFKPNKGNYNYYDTSSPPVEEKQDITYTWREPRQKDPGANYKPGKFKYLDEAIKNTKKDD